MLKAKLDPKQEPEETVITELREWQRTNCDKTKWIAHVQELRRHKLGDNAWILNELIREYELEVKRLKRHGIADDIVELGSELIRVPELLFSPAGLISYDQCGISEAIENVITNLRKPELSEVCYL